MREWILNPEADMPDAENLAFEIWLHESFSTVFDAVLREPVPDNMLELLPNEVNASSV